MIFRWQFTQRDTENLFQTNASSLPDSIKNDFSLDKIYELNKITRSKEYGCANKI